MAHWFKLALPDDIIRTLNKQQYKRAMHWLRQCRRQMEPVVKAKVDSFLHDIACYGVALIGTQSFKELYHGT